VSREIALRAGIEQRDELVVADLTESTSGAEQIERRRRVRERQGSGLARAPPKPGSPEQESNLRHREIDVRFMYPRVEVHPLDERVEVAEVRRAAPSLGGIALVEVRDDDRRRVELCAQQDPEPVVPVDLRIVASVLGIEEGGVRRGFEPPPIVTLRVEERPDRSRRLRVQEAHGPAIRGVGSALRDQPLQLPHVPEHGDPPQRACGQERRGDPIARRETFEVAVDRAVGRDSFLGKVQGARRTRRTTDDEPRDDRGQEALHSRGRIHA
jgi:hypothetical protein